MALQKPLRNKYIILSRCYSGGREKRRNRLVLVAFCMTAAIEILFAVPFHSYSGGLNHRNRPLNFPAPKFPFVFFAFPLKDQMVNYTWLAFSTFYLLRLGLFILSYGWTFGPSRWFFFFGCYRCNGICFAFFVGGSY